LPNLNSLESLQVIEAIVKSDQNLGMKIEALTILPDITHSPSYNETCRILQIALCDSDPEVVRNALLAIQRMPGDLPVNLLTDRIFQLLNAEDTDLQYHAILSLSRLRSQISSQAMSFYILPLTHHRNVTLREAAKSALCFLVSDTEGKRAPP
jgi:hypothetical protein